MTTKTIKISDNNKYQFPTNWNVNEINQFLKSDFKICPYCSKVDIRMEHLNDCTGYSFNSDDNNWK